MNESTSATSHPCPSPATPKPEWREMGRRALLLLALLAAMYAPVWMAGRTLMPWDGVEQSEWSKDAPRPLTRTALDTADTLFLLVPWDEYSLRCVKEGEWPWWNPYQGLGHPHWENIVTTGLSPGMWLEAALPAGLKEFVWLGQLWVAAIFTMMLARALGLGWGGTTLAGVAVITAPHFELYLTQRHMSGTAMWWPLALWGVECIRRSFQSHPAGDPGAALTSRLLGFCGTAAGTWGLLTGGNPSITLAGGCGLVLYAVVRVPWQTGFRSMLACGGWLALAGISGLLLAAPAWANFFPWLALCYNRKLDPISLTPGNAGHIVFAPAHIGTLLLPYIYGQAMEYPYGRISRWLWSAFGGWHAGVVVFLSLAGLPLAWKHKKTGLLLLGLMTLGAIARTYGVPGLDWVARLPLWQDVSFTRYAAFIPVFGFALLAGYGFEACAGAAVSGKQQAPASPRVRLAMAGIWVTLLSFLLWLAFRNLRHGVGWSAEAVTQWRQFAVLGLFWTVAPVLALLWNVGAQSGDENAESVSGDHSRALWPAVLGLALAAVVFAPWGYAPLTCALLGVAGGILLLAATLCAHRLRPEAWLSSGGSRGQAALPRTVVLAGALAAVAALPLCASLWAKNGLPPKFDPIPKGGLMQALAKLQSANYSRSWSLDGLPVPNHAMASGIFSLNVIDGLITREEAGYTSKYIDPHCPPLWLAGNVSFLRTPGETPLDAYLSKRAFYEFASVRYVTSLAALPGLHPLLRDDTGMILWEDSKALPRVRLVAPEVAAMRPPDAVSHGSDPTLGVAEIQSFGPNGVKIRATNSKPCILVLADAPKAGWSASLNGRPAELLTAHGCFRAVELARAGTWEVEMQYRPPWWDFSWILAGAGFLALALPCGWALKARRSAAHIHPASEESV